MQTYRLKHSFDTGVVLLDIAFVPEDPEQGFILGTRKTILETKDSGETWVMRSILSDEDEDCNYRFNSISLKGKEGWIVGIPAILLHTSDFGVSWELIPLSSQLPGDMRISEHQLNHPFIFRSHLRCLFRSWMHCCGGFCVSSIVFFQHHLYYVSFN